MTDPNLRRPRHGKPAPKGAPRNTRPNPTQAYRGAAGTPRPAAPPGPGAPRRQNAAGPSNPAGRPIVPVQAQTSGRRPRTGKNRAGSFFIKAAALLILCLAAGMLWLYMNNNTVPGITSPGTANNQPPAATPAFTDQTIPNTKIISFSQDPSKPLYGKVIILDPGHGGTDSGCSYPTKKPTLFESDLNLTIAQSVKSALEEQGATVIMLRTDDSWISLYSRIALTHLNCLQYAREIGSTSPDEADKSRLISKLTETLSINSDTIDTGGMGIMVGTGVSSDLALLMDLEKDFTNILYLSIHINSNQSASVHGTQVYYVTDESVIASESQLLIDEPTYANNPDFPVREDYYGRNGQRNAALAQSLYDSIVESVPQMESNAKPVLADNYAVLRENNLTGAMIEVGFITNKKDRSRLTDEESIRDIAYGIASGCVNFFAENP